MDTENARFIRCRGNHPARVGWQSTHNDGFPAIFWVVELFNRGKKCVHIDVQKNAAHTAPSSPALILSVSSTTVFSAVLSHAVTLITELAVLSAE